MKLNEICDNPGATKARIRVGRGIGSGKGKQGGRGGKGQTARSGVAIKGFEGGQMPLHRRLPKRGFKNPNAKRFAVVSLARVQAAIEAGRIDAAQPVDAAVLVAAGMFSNARDGVRLLGGGEITSAVTFDIAGASKSAVEAVEKAGGKVNLPAVAAPEAEAAS